MSAEASGGPRLRRRIAAIVSIVALLAAVVLVAGRDRREPGQRGPRR